MCIYSASSKLLVTLRNARRLYLHANIKLCNCTVIITPLCTRELPLAKYFYNDIKFKMTPRNGIITVIPPLAKSSTLRNQTLYDRSFAVQGPKLWNKVPNTVKTAQSFDSFKISLPKFLALIPDNPPVSGYSCSWSNSLVDYTPTRWSDIWWPFQFYG